MPAGRPSEYTREKADAICAGLALGQSIAKVIAQDESLPSIATVYKWMRDFPEFLNQYARAKEDAADLLAEQIIDIADDGLNDTYTKPGKDGEPEEVVNHDHINRSRLRVEARKWVAAKLKPKKYGDKIQQEITGKLSLEQLLAQASQPQDDHA